VSAAPADRPSSTSTSTVRSGVDDRRNCWPAARISMSGQTSISDQDEGRNVTPLTRNAITERYLAEIARRGVPAGELPELAQRSFELKRTTFMGRCLTRPSFLDHASATQLDVDLKNLHTMLTSLPDRLFSGDVAAFARAVRMTEAQLGAIMRNQEQPPTGLARADFYLEHDQFKVMEVNYGSTVGGVDNVLLNRAFLTHPVVADFVAANNLSYVDTLDELAQALRRESGLSADDRPYVVAADWPASFAEIEPWLTYSAEQMRPYGIDMSACHVGQLEVKGGRVWFDGRPVDVVFRLFMIEDLLDPAGPELIDPVLRAAERGEVKIFTPLHTELYGSKSALAMLSDEQNRHLYSAAELATIDRIMPWTRMVRPGPVTVAGAQVDLVEYALEQRADLVLKPTAMHGGIGVVLGWLVTPDEWQSQLKSALDGPYVLQRRILAEPELFPAEGGLEPWVLTWAAFIANGRHAGMFIRGSADASGAVVNMATGASATCCFQETSPAAG
jgi:glutathionylspermidine synthase